VNQVTFTQIFRSYTKLQGVVEEVIAAAAVMAAVVVEQVVEEAAQEVKEQVIDTAIFEPTFAMVLIWIVPKR
jgi:hypothetical protein